MKGGDVMLYVATNGEIGPVMLSELRSVRGQFLLNIETLRHWKPTPLSKYREVGSP